MAVQCRRGRGGDWLVQFRIFPGRAAGLAHGVLPRVGRRLGPDGLVDVHAKAVGQQKAADQDIGEFVDDLLSLGGGHEVGRHLVFRLPQEVFLEFAGFDGDRRGEILGVVKLFPVAIRKEVARSLAEYVKLNALKALNEEALGLAAEPGR